MLVYHEYTWHGLSINALFSKTMPKMYSLYQITCVIHANCLLDHEAVMYLNDEEYEGERHRGSITKYQTLGCLVFGE